MVFNTEVLVIGSGPGGSISAAKLVENGFNVILAEAGTQYKLNSFKHFSIDEMKNKYKYGGLSPTFGKPNTITLNNLLDQEWLPT